MEKTINICKELGQKVPTNIEIEFKVSYNGGYYLTTDLKLKGRGIRMYGDGSDHKRGKKTYHATALAMNKLEAQYRCAYMELL